MANTETPNYQLLKPDPNDFYDVNVANTNMDKIDTILKQLASAIASGATAEQIEELENAIGNLEGLETETKTNLVVAINSLKQTISSHLTETASDEVRPHGMGTAASKNVQESLADDTDGRLMQVGAFGLGSRGIDVPNDDCNLIIRNGFYRLANITVNAFPNKLSGDSLMHCSWSDLYGFQIGVSRSGSKVWVRHQSNGVWSEWNEIFRSSVTTPSDAGCSPLNLEVQVYTGNKTLNLSDGNGKLLIMNYPNTRTFTIPADSAVDFPIGTQVLFAKMGTGDVPIVGQEGVTINSVGGKTKLRTVNSIAGAIKIAANTWLLFGDLGD